MTRSDREKLAYEHGSHIENRRKIQSRLAFLYQSPNSRRESADFDKIVRESVAGKKVLEVGCGRGWNAKRILDLGAREVHGVDLSPEMLADARRLESRQLHFYEHDICSPLGESYDVIVGRAILHHVDYKQALRMLSGGLTDASGRMFFMEPLGDNLIMSAYWKFGTKFHTADERPFRKADIKWLRAEFPSFTMLPYNYVSLPAALLMSIFTREPTGLILNVSDTVDQFIARNMQFLSHRFRTAIFCF